MYKIFIILYISIQFMHTLYMYKYNIKSLHTSTRSVENQECIFRPFLGIFGPLWAIKKVQYYVWPYGYPSLSTLSPPKYRDIQATIGSLQEPRKVLREVSWCGPKPWDAAERFEVPDMSVVSRYRRKSREFAGGSRYPELEVRRKISRFAGRLEISPGVSRQRSERRTIRRRFRDTATGFEISSVKLTKFTLNSDKYFLKWFIHCFFVFLLVRLNQQKICQVKKFFSSKQRT